MKTRNVVNICVVLICVYKLNLSMEHTCNHYLCLCRFQQHYERAPEERDMSPVELALRRYLLADQGHAPFRSSMYNLLSTNNHRTLEENTLKEELSKIFRPVAGGNNDIVLMRPRTIKSFLEHGDDNKQYNCLCCKVSFASFSEN